MYTDVMRQSIHAVKYQNKREYLEYFAQEMAQTMKHEIEHWRPEVLIPIPMHETAKRIRGYNQAEILAKHLGKELDLPVALHSLKKIRKTANQKELDHLERQKNLKGAFALELPEGKQVWERVLLVDDIYTTGSTIEEAARTLKKSGVKEVSFVVICMVPQ